MQVNSASTISALYQQNSQGHSSASTKTQDGQRTIDDSVSFSNAGRNAEQNWQAIAAKYDVTNINYQDRGAMTNELMSAGLIPSEVGLAMMAPSSMNFDPNKPENFLQSSKQSLEFAKSNGAPQQQVNLMENTVNVLETLYKLSAEA